MFRAIPYLTIASVVLVSTAHGQYPYSPYGYGYGWGSGGSTVAGSTATGMANLVNAAGSYNLQSSQAAINLEQARSQDLDNRLKGTQTYFDMRKINTESRRAEEGRRMTTEEAWRYAQIGAPKRVTPYELDPVTGKIYWPLQLQDPKYDEYRQQLDQLFRQREVTHGSVGYDVYTKIQSTTTAFLGDLKKNINTLPSGDYIKAKAFVESLAHESRFPAA